MNKPNVHINVASVADLEPASDFLTAGPARNEIDIDRLMVFGGESAPEMAAGPGLVRSEAISPPYICMLTSILLHVW